MRLWAPSCKCWALTVDPSKACLHWALPRNSQEGPPFSEEAAKMCSPSPSQGGGSFLESSPPPSFLHCRISPLFQDPRTPQKSETRCQNASKMKPKVIPEGSLKRSRNRFCNKKVPTLSSTHYLLYIQQVGHLQKPSIFDQRCFLKWYTNRCKN